MVLTTSGLRDGETTREHSNGTSTVSPRPSRTTTGNLTLLIFNPTEDHQTSDALLPTQDGGKFSDTKVPQSLTTKVRLLKYKVESIKRTETLE
jgi:hypothetical protein